jgi:adenylate cyclase
MAVLYLFRAGQRSAAFLLGGRVVPVGRDPANRIVLADPTVSRFQFLLSRSGSRYIVEDAGSRWGTFINGKRVTGPVMLRRGSWIGAGCLRLLYWDEPWPSGTDADVAASRTDPLTGDGSAPALQRRRRLRSFAFRVWWRLSHRSLAFGWKVRRR